MPVNLDDIETFPDGCDPDILRAFSEWLDERLEEEKAKRTPGCWHGPGTPYLEEARAVLDKMWFGDEDD